MSSYYDVDDILAEDQLMPVTFTIDAADLGYLDENSGGGKTLRAGTTVELPFWLAGDLATRKMVQLSLPKFLHPAFRISLLADPTCVDLCSRCPYFYEIGSKIAALTRDDSMVDALKRSISERYQQVIDKAQSRSHDPLIIDFAARLTLLEKKLFDAKKLSYANFARWRTRKMTALTSSHLINKKRKAQAVALQ